MLSRRSRQSKSHPKTKRSVPAPVLGGQLVGSGGIGEVAVLGAECAFSYDYRDQYLHRPEGGFRFWISWDMYVGYCRKSKASLEKSQHAILRNRNVLLQGRSREETWKGFRRRPPLLTAAVGLRSTSSQRMLSFRELGVFNLNLSSIRSRLPAQPTS